MKKYKSFYRYTGFVLVIIFLVIIAGSVVRTTQSGMGCPDWPKCFGQYIPPTSMEQVIFSPNKNYQKGQFIIYNDSLKYARTKFISSSNFNAADWLPYTKHNNASFAVYKTWIEYVNRLLGALLGLFILIQVIWSFLYRKEKSSYFIYSLALLFLTGFQAWLGKTVVDSNLAVLKISLHLVGALAMVLLEIMILHKIKPISYSFPKKLVNTLYVFMGLLLVQLFLGVLVRQEVDQVSEQMLFLNRDKWLPETGTYFYIHRSFSLLLTGLALFIFFRHRNFASNPLLRILWGILFLQMTIGIIFTYLSFPAWAQPFHLVLSSILLAILFLLLLRKR